MKEELNIAAILKDKPEGTKLWSPIVGHCTFNGISSKNGAIVASFVDKDGEQLDWDFNEFGKTLSAPKEAEVCLFPSKQMQDWSKFAWKKGDVLVDGCNNYSIFVEFDKGTGYANAVLDFLCNLGDSLVDYDRGKSSYPTQDWSKVPDEKAKKVILHIEKCLGGKLNLETLQIEKKQEFKDGDILHNDETNCSCETIFIANIHGDIIGTYAYIIVYNKELYTRREEFDESEKEAMRLATEEEKQQLFSALANEGKRWNPETKQIEDLTEKCEFKAFDKVLVRNGYEDKWEASFFSYEDCIGLYYTVGGKDWCECIPYNKETAHLLGTTDEYKPKNK